MLSYGMSKIGLENFCKKHEITYQSNLEQGSVQLIKRGAITISPIPGDCTAASINTHECSFKYIKDLFKLLPEFLSLNARISCFFSLNRQEDEIESILKFLKEFQIVGLHIQHNNRVPEKNTYQISGILKVPNAFIKTYERYDGKPVTHNHTLCDNFNRINKQYNLETL